MNASALLAKRLAAPGPGVACAEALAAAADAYHNGKPLLMTDEEFDAGVEALRAADPTHPFLLQIGAPLNTGDEVALPLPLPSLNKIKPDGSLEKWLAKFPAADYHVSVKLDGCSALWLPASKKLYTRGDGMRGRDISAFVPYFKGLVAPTTPTPIAIRGELIMRTDSPAIPQGKLARNIVAGALNRKDADPALFAEIRFVAYALENPVDQSPEAAFKTLRRLGYEVARASMLSTTAMTPTRLSELFSAAEATSPYQLDGIVVAPNVSRPATWAPEVRKGAAINPADRVAWKTRIAATTARTTVRSVEWNISAGGVIIPRVLFDSVVLAGANISAATGLHGRWIYENSVGPGATIEVRRAGDVIPQILAVHAPSPTGPAMPPAGTWAWDGPADSAVHIRPTGGSAAAEADCAILTRTLAELGAENVGPGVVAKLYAAGFRTLGQILGATAADFAARVEGFKVAAAQRTYEGLRAGAASWTELNFMVASCCFGRGVGHLKLKPLLEIQPDPARWSTAALGRPTGLSEKTVQEIVAAVPAYLAWRAANGLPKVPALPAAAAAAATTGSKMTVVLTGFRSKELEAALVAAGHTVADAVSKKTTHVAYPDGPEPTSTKLTKAKEVGATLLTASALRALLV